MSSGEKGERSLIQRMKALSTLKSALDQGALIGITALVLLAPVFYPQLALAAEAQALGQQNQVFEIKVTNPNSINTNTQSQSLTLNDIQQADPLFVSLQNYLQDNGSPLQAYTGQLLSHDNWKTIVAISFVESNMCVHNYYYNCSGIGGQQYLRKYNNYGEWIDDMSNVLATRYNGWSLDKMDGVYVQPYSVNWKLGSKKVYAQLTALEQSADAARTQLAQQSAAQSQSNQDLATIAQ